MLWNRRGARPHDRRLSLNRLQSIFLLVILLLFIWTQVQVRQVPDYSVEVSNIDSVREPSIPLSVSLEGAQVQEHALPVAASATEIKQDSTHGGTTLLDSRPRHLRLVLVGDSLSRYTYLTLAYFLKTGNWVPLGHRLIEKVKDDDPNSWNNWLYFTHTTLQPQEVLCDCYRHWIKKFKWRRHCENRYFVDLERDNYVIFLTNFGQDLPHGHVNATDVAWEPKGTTIPSWNSTRRPYSWNMEYWDSLIANYIAKLTPKPDFVLFNQGHWKNHAFRDAQWLSTMKTTFQQSNIQGIYRTTTFRSDEMGFADHSTSKFRNHDAKVCQLFPCVNVSWTADTPPDEYVDPVHFKVPANNRMAQQVLAFLKEEYPNSRIEWG